MFLNRVDVLVALALIQLAAVRVHPEAQSTLGSITGVVFDTSDSKPLRRAIVTIAGESLAVPRASVTDDEGRFEFRRLPPGLFTVRASKPAYLSSGYGAARPGHPMVPVRVIAGGRVADLSIGLFRGGAIEGRIKDSQGAPVQGIQVSAFRMRSTGEAVGPVTVSSDDTGSYRLFGLEPGEYVVAASVIYAGAVSAIGSRSAAETDAIFAALERRQRPGSMSVEPRADTGQPTNYAPVFHPSETSSSRAVRIAVTPGVERMDVDITLQLVRVAAVEGTVVASAALGSDVQVGIIRRGPIIPLPYTGPMPTIRPDSNGRFRYANLGPGSYTILAMTARPPVGAAAGTAGPRLWASADVEVAGQDVSGITLVMQPGSRVAGKLVADTLRATPSVWPALRVTLVRTAIPNTFDFRMLDAVTASAPVAPDRTFSLEGILPGIYRVSVEGLPAGWWPSSARMGDADVLDTFLEVTPLPGRAYEIDVVLSGSSTGLSGNILVPQGAKASDYVVLVIPVERRFWSQDSRRVRAIRADTQGRYMTVDLPPGDYFIGALSQFEPDSLGDVGIFEALRISGLRVSVRPGEHLQQSFRIGGTKPLTEVSSVH